MTPLQQTRAHTFALRVGVITFMAAVVTACATPHLPMSGERVQIHELHCNADQSVVATASMRVPGAMLETEGALLYSPDGGLTWSVTARGDNLRGITPRFFNDPRDGSEANRPLVVTGYKSGFQWTYPLGGWMKSTDSGSTWASIPARLPAVGSQDPVGWPPPLVVVDETGRLATIRKAPSPALLTSDDNGATWSETRLPAIDGLNDLSAEGRGRLIAVGWSTSPAKAFGAFRTVVVQSDDSGKTWSVAMDEVGTGPCVPSIIGTPDGPMLINYGCAESDRHYFFSADGGRTWQARRFNRYAYGAFELVTAVDEKRWAAISIDGRSLVAWTSDNGGDAWRDHATGFAIRSGSRQLYSRSIVTLPGGVLLAYVADGQILRSADRGESWRLIDSGLPRDGNYALDARCTDGHKLVVLGGGQGMLIRSLDGGLTWERGRFPSTALKQSSPIF
ncbi:MAG: sialidase family protein [Burkholderiaceae bacterium]|nr:sialidase family protein [Burkholderiaceae bacterium]